MQSPPASTEPITVSAFAPLLAPADPASVTAASIRSPTRSRWANSATGTSPACDTRWGSSKLTETRDNSCEACIWQMTP